jgi:Raf kinase inhibitor-like YbhB/YbcL family protein
MRIANGLLTAAAVLGLAVGMMVAQGPPGGGGGKGGGKGGKGGGRGGLPAPMVLTVAGYADGGMIPNTIGCTGGQPTGKSPQIDWTGAPMNAAAFAMIMHDADMAMNGSDILHWAIFDIPGTATGLPADLAKTAELPDGSKQLNNIGGMPGFFNPCPPAPTTHHYIIELYALSAKLGLPATTSRADLEKALLAPGATLSKGVYAGTYKQ